MTVSLQSLKFGFLRNTLHFFTHSMCLQQIPAGLFMFLPRWLCACHLVELLTLTFIPFPKRFNDIHVPIRLECVKFASHCLMNHPDLAKDLTGKSAEMHWLETCSRKMRSYQHVVLPLWRWYHNTWTTYKLLIISHKLIIPFKCVIWKKWEAFAGHFLCVRGGGFSHIPLICSCFLSQNTWGSDHMTQRRPSAMMSSFL